MQVVNVFDVVDLNEVLAHLRQVQPFGRVFHKYRGGLSQKFYRPRQN